jgi:hypothetical protein
MTAGDERAMLLGWLDAQRKHALGTLDGLDEQALRRPVLPSGWSALAMIRHLTIDEERFWFRAAVAAEQAVIDEFGSAESDYGWQLDPEDSAAEVIAAYRREIERSNAIIEATPLDASPAWWPAELFGSWRLDSLREIMLHMIAEVACHAGHLDAVRELIDGNQWLVLTGD